MKNLKRNRITKIVPSFQGKSVLVLGGPATGKSYLASWLLKCEILRGYKFIATDHYLGFGYEKALYKILDDLNNVASHTPTFIEGILGYRLLRKGAQWQCYKPDIIVELFASPKQIEYIYRHERSEEKLKRALAFGNMHQKILSDWIEILQSRKEKMPVWYKIDNTFLL